MKYRTDTLQDPVEIEEFCEIVKAEECSSYLEIGSKFGSSLWRAAQSMPKGSRIVSVDLPNGTKAWTESRLSLVACVDELKKQGYDARIIWGDSQSFDVVRQVAVAGPFDCVMIDADHRIKGVTTDFENYGPMSRKMVAFHDISWRRAPDWQGVRIDVPEFWDSIKSEYRHKEIRHDTSGKNNGIGVLWKD